ncbi:NAC domain-containing protein 67-like [Malania oleifera]|uniref:NAC domain-containing protein 67-like n=1 Tax=Malania oleifera TaxID=397392 RepID=UPI0025AE54E8|nr:NAC domain-containing protein 67-like [Malania oleifera]
MDDDDMFDWGSIWPDLLEEQSYATGFRFYPTDSELILHYLSNKVANRPVDLAAPIFDVDIYQHHPLQLSEWYRDPRIKELYFFTPRNKKYPNGHRPQRVADNGYWKATGANKPILDNGAVIGYKITLV